MASIQGAFKETNKLCQQCIKACKQFANVKIVKCFFVSNQKGRHTLPLAKTTICRGKEGHLSPITEKA